MSTVRDFHNPAMDLALRSLIAHYQGNLVEAENLAREAYELESKAAALVPCSPESEPTRSILYRSAATLAHQCHEYDDAQRLVAEGLAGSPPPQIKRELQELMERIRE